MTTRTQNNKANKWQARAVMEYQTYTLGNFRTRRRAALSELLFRLWRTDYSTAKIADAYTNIGAKERAILLAAEQEASSKPDTLAQRQRLAAATSRYILSHGKGYSNQIRMLARTMLETLEAKS